MYQFPFAPDGVPLDGYVPVWDAVTRRVKWGPQSGGGGLGQVLQQERWVSQSATPGGNGSPGNPFTTLAAAIADAPSIPLATLIRLSPGDYEPEGGIAYTDKRLSVQGTQLFNQSATSTPTHGVWLRPSCTSGVLTLEVCRTNCNIIAQTVGVIVVAEDCYVEAISDGVNLADWVFSGTGTDTMRGGTQGTLANTIRGNNMGLADSVTLNGFSLLSSSINGPLSMAGNTSTSLLQDCFIQYPLVAPSPGTLWQLFNCRFPADGTGVVITTNVETDLATYERGIKSGVTFPLNTEIIDL